MIRQIKKEEIEFLFGVARLDKHRNSKNYQNNRIDKYIAFHVFEDERDIIAFSGIFPFKDGYCRVADRTYLMPNYRSKGLNSLGHVYYLSRHLLPFQTEVALSLGYKPFYSIQEKHRRKSLDLSVNDFNNTNNKNFRYNLLDGMYYTCDEYVEGKEECWQNIALISQENEMDFRNSFRHRP